MPVGPADFEHPPGLTCKIGSSNIGKPGGEGSEAIVQLAEQSNGSQELLDRATGLDWRQRG